MGIKYFKVGDEPFVLNRGRLLARKDEDSQWQDLCVIKDFKISVATEKAEAKDMTRSIVTVARSTVTSIKLTGGFTLSTLTKHGLAYFLMSNGYTEDEQASGTWTAEEFTIPTVGEWFDLGKRKLTVTGITDDATPTPAPLEEGTDYDIDLTRGLIVAIEGGAIADGDKILVTGTYPDHKKYTIKAAQTAKQYRHLWLCSDPADGPTIDIKGYGIISPTGDFNAVVENEYIGMGFEINFRSHSDYGPGGAQLEELE